MEKAAASWSLEEAAQNMLRIRTFCSVCLKNKFLKFGNDAHLRYCCETALKSEDSITVWSKNIVRGFFYYTICGLYNGRIFENWKAH